MLSYDCKILGMLFSHLYYYMKVFVSAVYNTRSNGY